MDGRIVRRDIIGSYQSVATAEFLVTSLAQLSSAIAIVTYDLCILLLHFVIYCCYRYC